MSEYERQRLHKLKSNAERMKSRGLESIANEILQKKYQVVVSTWTNEELFLDEDEFTHESESDDIKDVTGPHGKSRFKSNSKV
ncbi:hypothetical protein BVRB_2g037840 [Beta vulgaris subsp. vulgaris]|nr:hypothetical protein BVRB_2g037840 [Beta vulgaris subsp. vulgaris]